ncbi:MAG TPA: TRAP transporter small permease [Pusillimonas sp.]|uniref:TRAP transporter small permease n=1 Tax=unclassified Pusillimonas TaxID=2640016 RepID=UPI002627B9B8|nr:MULTISPECIES: TRAP transporter small permease [unclassified Pusillimonas]HLU20194.1 TRAP transporter small permease [Pusillimonas sp.]
MAAKAESGQRIHHWMRLVLRGLTLIAGLALAMMVCITMADVLLRNLFGIPVLGTYDLVETLMVFVVFLGIGEAFLDDTHITVDIIDHFISSNLVVLLKIVGLLLSAVFLGMLLWHMPTPAWEAYVYQDRKPDLPIMLYWLWIPCLVGVFAALIAALFKLSDLIRSRRRASAGRTHGVIQ